MYIVEQGRDSVTNLEHFGTIERCGCQIVAYRWLKNEETENILATYETVERAAEVFNEMLVICFSGDEVKTFWLPEE